MEITREQLTSAFAMASVRIAIDKFSARDGDDYTEGHVRYPQVAADVIMGALNEIRDREPHPTGPRTEDADLCASCGNQFKPGQVCDSCRTRDPWADPWAGESDVPVVHIHCEHAPASRAAFELRQADKIVELLGRQPDRHVRRVLRWVWDYLTDGDEPPF